MVSLTRNRNIYQPNQCTIKITTDLHSFESAPKWVFIQYEVNPTSWPQKNCRTTKWLLKQKGRPSWHLFWKSVFPTKTNQKSIRLKQTPKKNKKSPIMLRSGPWFPPTPPFRVRRLAPFFTQRVFFAGQKIPPWPVTPASVIFNGP